MPTANTTIRDRLKEIRERSRELRDQRAEARRERDAAKDAFAGAEPNGQKITEMPEFKNAEEAVRKVGEIDDELNELKNAEEAILKLLGEDTPASNGHASAAATAQRVRGWDAHALLQGDAYQHAIQSGIFSSSAKFGTIQLGEIASREDAVRFLSELPNATPGPVDSPSLAGLIQPDRRGLIPPVLRPLRFLDLIPTGTTNSNSIEYVQVIAIPGTAAPVAEGALKPEEGIEFQDATSPVRTIAGWIKVNRQAMDDGPGLASIINTLLPYDVRRKIEGQVINGDGTGQNLTGILHTTGVLSVPPTAGDNPADALLRMMTAIILTDHEPNFAAMHPMDVQDLLLMRDDSGGAGTGAYLYGGPSQSFGTPTVWGLALTPTTQIAEGKPLVGDSNASTLLVREGVNVKTSDSDQDDFVKNRVTVLAEARVAYLVWYPSAFAVPGA
jgi:HK97 family phage major capsid protein